jgi:hypothetical protein
MWIHLTSSVCSRALVAVCWGRAPYWDGPLSVSWNGIATLQAFSPPGSPTDFCMTPPSGMTCSHLTADPGAATLMSSARAFPASRSASRAPTSGKAIHETAGPQQGALLARWDRASSSWRTSQVSLLSPVAGTLERFSASFPTSGLMSNGRLFLPSKSARRTKGKGFGFTGTMLATPTTIGNQFSPSMQKKSPSCRAWSVVPTPQASDSRRGDSPSERRRKSPSLPSAVAMLPTPNAADHRNRGNPDDPSILKRRATGKQINLSMTVLGPLNPDWTEWLMGWPPGWTESKPLAMGRFLWWLRLHGDAFMAQVDDV